MLEEFRAPMNLKLATLWASLMFLYIYNDYFSRYTPGTIAEMSAGRLGPFGPASPGVLAGVSVMLAVPALINRWVNILLGVAYTAIEVLTLSNSALFYRIVVVLEIVLTRLVVWYAVRWPKTEVST